MNIDYPQQQFEYGSEQPDEGYWAALLDENEQPLTIGPTNIVAQQTVGLTGDDYDGHPRTQLVSPDDVTAIRQHLAEDGLTEWRCVGYNRGGLLAEWRSLRGFIPASQLLNLPATQNHHARRKALLEYVGHKLSLRIIEFDEDRSRLILSERAAQVGPGERDTLLQSLSPGDVVEGLVTNLRDFGAFVDLGGLEGLIHISELSWSRINHPANILRPGETVRVHVLGVDVENGRIALSLKRLRPDPWNKVEERYKPGQVVDGIVSNVVEFGAFVLIEEGLEGLIHVSELAEGQFLHPRNVVQEGQAIQAQILNISAKARRMGLSLR